MYLSNLNVRCISCSGFYHPQTTDVISPKLVEDGTKCGDDSVCYNQRCVNASSLLEFPSCPNGSNGAVCSGNGVRMSASNGQSHSTR